jgi:protein phosphatase
VEDKAVLAHIGDSRIYLCRDGETKQVTTDHTFVQRLVEMGRITEDEALVHPRRNVLLRVIGDSNEPPQLDFNVLVTKPGDRWMMCSDGLNGYVSDAIIHMNLSSEQTPEEVVDVLIGEALEAGAPDNVTVVVVDTVPAELSSVIERTAKFVGSAVSDVVVNDVKTKSKSKDSQDRQFISESGEDFNRIINETERSVLFRKLRQIAMVFSIAGLIVLVAWFGYGYTQTKFYVAEAGGQVSIYKGIREELLGFKFSQVYKTTDLSLMSLPAYQQQLVAKTIYATDIADAYRIIDRLKASVPVE